MCPDHLARYVSPAIVAALRALVPMRPAPAAPWRAQPPAAADEGEQATAAASVARAGSSSGRSRGCTVSAA